VLDLGDDSGEGGINRGFVDEWRLLVLAEKQEGGAEKRYL